MLQMWRFLVWSHDRTNELVWQWQWSVDDRPVTSDSLCHFDACFDIGHRKLISGSHSGDFYIIYLMQRSNIVTSKDEHTYLSVCLIHWLVCLVLSQVQQQHDLQISCLFACFSDNWYCALAHHCLYVIAHHCLYVMAHHCLCVIAHHCLYVIAQHCL